MKSRSFSNSPLIVVVGFFLFLPAVPLGAAGNGAAGHGSLSQSDSMDRSGPRPTMLSQVLPFQAPETPEIESPKPAAQTPRIQGGGGAEQSPGRVPASRDASATRSSDSGDRAKGSEIMTAEGQEPVKKKRASAKAQQTLSTAIKTQKTSVGSAVKQPPGQAALPLSTSTPGISSRSPLPPALPYQPPATGRDSVGRTPPLIGGDSIFAKIPQADAPSSHSRLQKPKPSEPVSSSAGAIGPQESFDSFVMNSFRGARSSSAPSEGPQQPTQDMPPSSLFGQLSQDIKQLGSGIKQTFSRIIPLGQ